MLPFIIMSSGTHIYIAQISDVRIGEIPDGQSVFVKPRRMNFKQDGRDRRWDLVESMSAVAALCYDEQKNAFLFVKQFRAAVYFNRMKENTVDDHTPFKHVQNTEQLTSHQAGCTVECIAGLLDKPQLTPLETMQEELREEIGYDVPLQNIQFITNYRNYVGVIGNQTSLYFAKIDESMKVNEGGGCAEEHEFIEPVWVSVQESRKFVLENSDIPPGLKFAVFWFYNTYPQFCQQLE